MPRKELQGVVLSAGKIDKTVKVRVTRTVKHTLYKKYIRKRKDYLVHDPKNECKEGDTVIIRESRPISKLKRWYVHQKLHKSSP
jgi:small subunit ribosomal protein S17